jgi:restriction system-associated AAA family ATPase
VKLISVKILGNNFRSLTANRLYKFNISDRKSRLSTKCFAGLNGSGKSNMLELLSEIFYFLDYHHLIHSDEIQKRGNGFGFEIEYLIPMKAKDIRHLYGESDQRENWMHIKIQKPLEEMRSLEFSLKPSSEEDSRFRTVDEETYLLLPKNIIAYTSGQNELVSNPFYKLKYHYFKDVVKCGGHYATSDRMFFIDDANNFNIFLSNFLLGDEKKLKLLKQVYGVANLNSFRITINQQNVHNTNIKLLDETKKIIERLKSCATCWDIQKVYGTKKRTQYVLDYHVNDSTIEAFRYHFSSAMNLFKALYQLDMLNLHTHSKKVKDLIDNAPKSLNVSDEIPVVDPNDQIFRIEKIMINKIVDDKPDNNVAIKYKNLSDGEHQFNEVIGSMMLMDQPGCLLLMDEPDTHFNPKWRARFIDLLNKMAATKYNKKGKITGVRDQEVIITTHSPFAISDSYQDDVYVFEKNEEGVEFKNPKIKTYGASISVILEHVFKNDHTIASISNKELDDIKAMASSVKGLEQAREKLLDFGESIERFNAIRYLRAKEKELSEER